MEQRFGKELYMEQHFGRLSLRASPSHENLTTPLAGSHRPFRTSRAPDGVAAATQTELFYLTSEDVALPDASPASMQHRPGSWMGSVPHTTAFPAHFSPASNFRHTTHVCSCLKLLHAVR